MCPQSMYLECINMTVEDAGRAFNSWQDRNPQRSLKDFGYNVAANVAANGVTGSGGWLLLRAAGVVKQNAVITWTAVLILGLALLSILHAVIVPRLLRLQSRGLQGRASLLALALVLTLLGGVLAIFAIVPDSITARGPSTRASGLIGAAIAPLLALAYEYRESRAYKRPIEKLYLALVIPMSAAGGFVAGSWIATLR